MKDIVIPIPEFNEKEPVEVDVKIGKNKMNFYFRVVSFPWESDDNETSSLMNIENLKREIKNYDKNWELIQIYTPGSNANKIQVLYRKKN